ncbi:MAG: hypothetical protein ACREFL_17785, partial [Stellaceae bacterium]
IAAIGAGAGFGTSDPGGEGAGDGAGPGAAGGETVAIAGARGLGCGASLEAASPMVTGAGGPLRMQEASAVSATRASARKPISRRSQFSAIGRV